MMWESPSPEVTMSADPQRVKAIFLAAADKPVGERAEFLDKACGGDAVLRQLVELSLDIHERGNNLSAQSQEANVPAFTQAVNRADEGPIGSAGTHIGPYKLLQQIGEGGMGTVWMAEQHEPVRRKVALKVIKPGMDSKEVLARFEAERQALALMDHPNIAKVLDAGRTTNGLPYFVMELVKGVPITKYCNEHQIATRERLELFVLVCQAIQHAHQKGVIHRDIKPSNVMVASFDGRPVPKVIDFGVAKAMGQQLTERTLFTTFGGIVGTLEYMSPEQAELNALDIDTRSDIYALGVLLYELLTGSTPLSRQRLKQAALSEALRMIREEEPPKPSTRLSESNEALPSVAAQRKTEPVKLTKLIRGELDWLVMKALDKDRNRRYETANAFAMDIQRYLHDEPVLASPPSATYILRKLAKRNKGPLVAAAVVLLALVGGVVGTALGLVEAQHQRDTAEQARLHEAEQRAAAEMQRTGAEAQRDRAVKAEAAARDNEQKALAERSKAEASEENAKQQEAMAKSSEAKALQNEAQARAAEAEVRAVLGFFENNLLAAARPKDQQGGLGVDVTIRAALDKAEQQISKAFHDKPLVENAIRKTLGETYFLLGEMKLAAAQLERVIELSQAHLGADHRDTLAVMDLLGAAYRKGGRVKDSLALLEKTVLISKDKLGAEDPLVLSLINNLANAYRQGGRSKDAMPLLEETLRLRMATLGQDHFDTQTTMNDLALAYKAAGRVQDAIPLYDKTLYLRKAELGIDHPNTLVVMGNLGAAYLAAGRLTEALPLLEETLMRRKAVLGIDHRDTRTTMNNLANAYETGARLDHLVPLREEMLTLDKTKLGVENPTTLNSMNSLAQTYEDAGRLGDAEPLWRELAAIWKRNAGADSPAYAGKLASLGHDLLKQQKYVDAEETLRECLAIREKTEPGVWNTFNTKSQLGESLLGQKKYTEAEHQLLQGYEGLKERTAEILLKVRVTRLTEAAERIVRFYEATGQDSQLQRWRDELEKAKVTVVPKTKEPKKK
jgi:eukaryotic-like serine/threonine-protein kinase